MPFEFRLPDLGEGIQEAEVLAWSVAPGDEVAAFQPLCQVESAKAAVELTSPVAGRVASLAVPAGAVAQRGDLLVVIDTDGGADSEWFGIVGTAPATSPTQAPKRVRAAPYVRKLARDLGVPLEQLHGSGPQGRVRAADVESAASRAQQPVAQHDERIPLKGLRREIAEHMVTAMREAPQVTSMDLLDATELVGARDMLQASAQEEGVKLTYLPFFVRACIEALKVVPQANARVEEDAIVLKREYHIGIATAIPGGLVVPVVKHADRLSILQIGREIERLISAARERKSTPEDLSGGTFSITSFGGLPGSPLFATPILNYPEVAILGIGRIDQQPRVVDGQVVPRMCVGISFTFDHRVLDGEAAGRFMAVLKRFVEQPLELLLRL
ncbi:MAG TPA: dihydrolipoamide acetyltransferase family protein [Chloroflexota bacterium]|nr:dihydrolipoamide acetyltransferase family protein [Chloroflexota bacterium]